MALGMKATYTKKGQSTVCRDFTDGSKVCMSKKGWNVFFATINKMHADETKPRPKKTQEATDKLIEWFTESALESPFDGVPQWVEVAEELINMPATNQQIRDYWNAKLDAFYKENEEVKKRRKEERMAVEAILGVINKEIEKIGD